MAAPKSLLHYETHFSSVGANEIEFTRGVYKAAATRTYLQVSSAPTHMHRARIIEVDQNGRLAGWQAGWLAGSDKCLNT